MDGIVSCVKLNQVLWREKAKQFIDFLKITDLVADCCLAEVEKCVLALWLRSFHQSAWMFVWQEMFSLEWKCLTKECRGVLLRSKNIFLQAFSFNWKEQKHPWLSFILCSTDQQCETMITAKFDTRLLQLTKTNKITRTRMEFFFSLNKIKIKTRLSKKQ